MVCAALALRLEMRPVWGAGHSLDTRIAAMAQGRPAIGLSTDGHNRVLELCRRMVLDPALWDATPAPDQVQPFDTVLAHCTAQTDAVLATVPTDASAWMMRALLAFEDFDTFAGFTALHRARTLAPHEGWIALSRVQMADPYRAQMTPDQRRDHEADLRLLGQSWRGTIVLARIYLFDEGRRPTLVDMIAELDTAAQTRFFNTVARLSADLAASASGGLE